MKAGYAEETLPIRRMWAMARRYVAFANDNPELYRLMTGRQVVASAAGKGERAQAKRPNGKMAAQDVASLIDPDLMAAQLDGIQFVQRAAAEVLGANPSPHASGMAFAVAWVVVHGLSQLLVDQRLSPQMFGLDDVEALVNELSNYIWATVPPRAADKRDRPR